MRQDPAGDIAPAPGTPIQLTLDADIQNRALEVFGEESGAAVMMDCRTGDILCLLSAPSFDANRFVKGLTAPEYRALAGYERKPLFNKALTATYPPGSTFKTMVALAALEHGVDPNRTYVCHGAWAWGGRVWHCDKAHGVLDMHDAIKAVLRHLLLSDRSWRRPRSDRRHGPPVRPGPGLRHRHSGPEARALFPTPPTSAAPFPTIRSGTRAKPPAWASARAMSASTPCSCAVMVSRLANGAKALEPRLVQSIGGVVQPSGAEAPVLPFAREHIDFVRAAMASVVESGTAAASGQLGLGPIKMAGKTGTAQAHTYTAAAGGAHGARGPGRCATTPGSSPSPPTTIRATP